eukprot:5351997-Karenia_brevis.AAC.1
MADEQEEIEDLAAVIAARQATASRVGAHRSRVLADLDVALDNRDKNALADLLLRISRGHIIGKADVSSLQDLLRDLQQDPMSAPHLCK